MHPEFWIGALIGALAAWVIPALWDEYKKDA
jgi:hypothetical protein